MEGTFAVGPLIPGDACHTPQMFFFISGGHIGAPKLYSNMASP